MYFNFFGLLAIFLQYYFLVFHLLNFYLNLFPRFFNDKPILLVVDDLSGQIKGKIKKENVIQ